MLVCRSCCLWTGCIIERIGILALHGMGPSMHFEIEVYHFYQPDFFGDSETGGEMRSRRL